MTDIVEVLASKGGRPTRDQVRMRRLKAIEDADLSVAEAALRIALDPEVAPAVRIQGMQIVHQFREAAHTSRSRQVNGKEMKP